MTALAEHAAQPIDRTRLAQLEAIQKKLLWLSSWTIHNANHLRPSRDKLKVGGHQASCASVATILTALYFDVLRPGDRVAVKPHASPIFHAAMYLLGLEDRERLQRFRALGGAQAYPSRTKDEELVDFSTGSVGLGAAVTLFASLTQDLIRLRGLGPAEKTSGRMVAIVGDAELDEGNIYEALLEGWKYDVRNVWWVIDYNRQSLDRVVPEKLFSKIEGFFDEVGWRVVTVKYGKKLQAAFAEPGGHALRTWIDACPNDLYAALTFKGGAAWRAHLHSDLGTNRFIRGLLDRLDDAALGQLMTNLGGHDLEAMLEAFHGVPDDRPHAFIAYTVKGWGLPLAGHKDNHSGLMTPEQMAVFREQNGIRAGDEWEPFAGLDVDEQALRQMLERVPWVGRTSRHDAAPVAVPQTLATGRRVPVDSTQAAFGKIMGELAKSDLQLAERIVTTAPDVSVSTSLGAWVSRREVFKRAPHDDVFKSQQVASPTIWRESPTGQHQELGIAENNLFLNLASLGLAHSLFGTRLLPIGTLYDPFIARGLDALTYATYQGARFILVATPSGISLAPEGGAHQSIGTPLIGMSLPGLVAYEPAFADEVEITLREAFDLIQRPDGRSVYLRLSTRQLDQPQRTVDDAFRSAVLDGGYWLRPPGPGAGLAIVVQGTAVAEAQTALSQIAEDMPEAGLLVATSPGRLFEDWRSLGAGSPIARLLAPLAGDARLVTVIDAHPATLAWLGAVAGHRVRTLGVDRFGQSADLPDLFRVHALDADSIVEACAAALVERARAA